MSRSIYSPSGSSCSELAQPCNSPWRGEAEGLRKSRFTLACICASFAFSLVPHFPLGHFGGTQVNVIHVPNELIFMTFL